MTDHDFSMINHAKARGPVIVTTKSGGTTTATLLAWKPRRGNTTYRHKVARVQFASGNQAAVPCDAVQLAP